MRKADLTFVGQFRDIYEEWAFELRVWKGLEIGNSEYSRRLSEMLRLYTKLGGATGRIIALCKHQNRILDPDPFPNIRDDSGANLPAIISEKSIDSGRAVLDKLAEALRQEQAAKWIHLSIIAIASGIVVNAVGAILGELLLATVKAWFHLP